MGLLHTVCLARSACSNGIKVSRKLVEERCLAALKEELFTPEAVDLFVEETTRLLAESNRDRVPELDRLQRKLAQVQQEITNIMNAIKAGILTSTTKGELERLEAQNASLEKEIKGITAKAEKVVTLLPRARERYEALVGDLGELSKRHVAQAREQVRELVGEIRLVPTTGGYLEAEMTGRYAGLVKLAVGAQLNNVVAGEGFEPSTFGL